TRRPGFKFPAQSAVHRQSRSHAPFVLDEKARISVIQRGRRLPADRLVDCTAMVDRRTTYQRAFREKRIGRCAESFEESHEWIRTDCRRRTNVRVVCVRCAIRPKKGREIREVRFEGIK